MVGERRCVSCQKLADKSQFWRVVRTAAGDILLDQGMGRSAYICPNLECLTTAQKKKRLAKSLRTNIPPQIFQVLHDRLAHQLNP
ncbi:MAG: YlxR family protein [Pseudanabaenaceae cyanobacterium]